MGFVRFVTNVVATGLGRLCPRLIYGRQPLHSYIKIFHRRDIGACPTWYIQEIPAEGLSGCQWPYVTNNVCSFNCIQADVVDMVANLCPLSWGRFWTVLIHDRPDDSQLFSLGPADCSCGIYCLMAPALCLHCKNALALWVDCVNALGLWDFE